MRVRLSVLLFSVFAALAPACANTRIRDRALVHIPPEDLQDEDVAELVEAMNVYEEDRRIAEIRASDMRGRDRTRVLTSSIVTAVGVFVTGIAQLALRDEDEETTQDWLTGIGLTLALPGAILTAVFEAAGSDDEISDLDQAAATITTSLTSTQGLFTRLRGEHSLGRRRTMIQEAAQRLREQVEPARLRITHRYADLVQSREAAVRDVVREAVLRRTERTPMRLDRIMRLLTRMILPAHVPVGDAFSGRLAERQTTRRHTILVEEGRCYGIVAVSEVREDQATVINFDLDGEVGDFDEISWFRTGGLRMVTFCSTVTVEHQMSVTMEQGAGHYLIQLYVHPTFEWEPPPPPQPRPQPQPIPVPAQPTPQLPPDPYATPGASPEAI